MQSDGVNKMDRVMRLPEIAATLGVCVRSVRRMIDRGELPLAVHNGRTVGLLKSDVESHLQLIRKQRGAAPQRSQV